MKYEFAAIYAINRGIYSSATRIFHSVPSLLNEASDDGERQSKAEGFACYNERPEHAVDEGQLRYLKEAGFDIELVSSPGDLLSRVPEREGVPVIAVPIEREISPWKDLKTLFRLWRLIRQKKPAPDKCWHSESRIALGSRRGLARVPCRIYTLRGLRLETTTGTRRRILNLAEKIACRCAHRVLCVSESLREQAIEMHLVKRKKTVVIGAGTAMV